MIGNKQKRTSNINSAGYSIIEALIAMSIFITVVTVAVDAFINAIEAQRVVVFEETIAENVNFAMEFISRQMRTAIHDPDGNCVTIGNTFSSVGPGIIKFRNAGGQCLEFRIQTSTGKLRYTSDATVPPGAREYVELISSGLVFVDSFDVILDGQNAGDNEQPRVTIVIEASGVPQNPTDPQNVTMTIQTTVTTRLPDS